MFPNLGDSWCLLFCLQLSFVLETISGVYYFGLLGMNLRRSIKDVTATTKSESFLQKGFILEVGENKKTWPTLTPISVRFKCQCGRGNRKKLWLIFSGPCGPERSTPPPLSLLWKSGLFILYGVFPSCRLRSTRSSYSSILFRILQIHTCFLPAWYDTVTSHLEATQNRGPQDRPLFEAGWHPSNRHRFYGTKHVLLTQVPAS